jgi:hypothetical protein
MSEPPTPQDRRFGDKQVGLILKRAAELQSEDSPSAGGSGGHSFSLGELEEIAAEAGIDPRFLRQAAREVELGSAGGGVSTALLGGPLTLSLARTLPGELSEDGFESLLGEIQVADLGHGNAAFVGRTMTWRSGGGDNQRSLQINVQSRDGATEIRIEERRHQVAGGLFGGIVGGGGGGLGLGMGISLGVEMGSVLFAVGFPLAIIALSYGVARAIYGGTGKGREKKLRALLDRLEARVRASAGSSRLPGDPDRGALPGPQGER